MWKWDRKSSCVKNKFGSHTPRTIVYVTVECLRREMKCRKDVSLIDIYLYVFNCKTFIFRFFDISSFPTRREHTIDQKLVSFFNFNIILTLVTFTAHRSLSQTWISRHSHVRYRIEIVISCTTWVIIFHLDIMTTAETVLMTFHRTADRM